MAIVVTKSSVDLGIRRRVLEERKKGLLLRVGSSSPSEKVELVKELKEVSDALISLTSK